MRHYSILEYARFRWFILDLRLYFHVPLAFMMLAALVAHVVCVFIYW